MNQTNRKQIFKTTLDRPDFATAHIWIIVAICNVFRKLVFLSVCRSDMAMTILLLYSTQMHFSTGSHDMTIQTRNTDNEVKT